jgi:hypothetical protein
MVYKRLDKARVDTAKLWYSGNLTAFCGQKVKYLEMKEKLCKYKRKKW